MERRCLVCGRVFREPEYKNPRQSLQAHLKVHKRLMCDFNVRIPKTLREDFKRLCEAHGVTTCHVMVALLSAAVESFRRGVVFEWDARTEQARMKEAANPLIININETFLGKPRSSYKLPMPGSFLSCHFLKHDDVWPGRLGWCHRVRRWVDPAHCEACGLGS